MHYQMEIVNPTRMKLFAITTIAISIASCGTNTESAPDTLITPPTQITGCWQETEESQPSAELRIGELRLDANGYFAVTWHPFEVYKDYWGDFEYNTADGTLSANISGSNYLPAGLNLTGRVDSGASGEIILLDMYLGEPYNSPNINQGPTARKYIFRKFAESCVGTTPI